MAQEFWLDLQKYGSSRAGLVDTSTWNAKNAIPATMLNRAFPTMTATSRPLRLFRAETAKISSEHWELKILSWIPTFYFKN